jgi:hypothetical protein
MAMVKGLAPAEKARIRLAASAYRRAWITYEEQGSGEELQRAVDVIENDDVRAKFERCTTVLGQYELAHDWNVRQHRPQDDYFAPVAACDKELSALAGKIGRAYGIPKSK